MMSSCQTLIYVVLESWIQIMYFVVNLENLVYWRGGEVMNCHCAYQLVTIHNLYFISPRLHHLTSSIGTCYHDTEKHCQCACNENPSYKKPMPQLRPSPSFVCHLTHEQSKQCVNLLTGMTSHRKWPHQNNTGVFSLPIASDSSDNPLLRLKV